MRRRDLSGALFLPVAGSPLVPGAAYAQPCAVGCYPQTTAERSVGVQPLDTSRPAGDLMRYGANPSPGTTDLSAALRQAAAQSVAPGGADVVVDQHCRIGSDVVVGGQVIVVAGGFHVDAGVTLNLRGMFSAPRSFCLRGAGKVIFGPGTVGSVFPEWFGARGDAAVDATHGTDSTASFVAAVGAATENGAGVVAVHPISIGPGCFIVGNLRLPPATTMRGTGRHTTNICCPASAVGDWWSDTGSAAKIVLEDFAMYGNRNPRLTAGLRLGYGAVPHGTEGYINRLWIRDIPRGVGLDVLGNVGLYDTITVYDSNTNIRITGSANMARGLIAEGGVAGSHSFGVWLGGTNVSGLEIEGMPSGMVPLRIDQNASIQGLWISLAPNTEFDHLWELGASATTWSVQNLTYYFSGPALVRGGNALRADGSYFGGNATGKPRGNHNGEGNYFSDARGQQLQCFVVQLVNAGGALRHRICEPGGGISTLASLIVGASADLADTPSGPDESTPFAAGGTVGSGAPGLFWLDTANQRISDSLGIAVVSFNTTGAALTVNASIQPAKIGGVRRNRLVFAVSDAATGQYVPLTPARIPPGRMVQISWQGYLSA